jgi:threonine dehydratase
MTEPGDRSRVDLLSRPLGVTLDDIEAAAHRLDGVANRTPLLSSRALDAAVGAQVRSKAEHLQRTGSFKFRGAYNRIIQLDATERCAGVVAFSSGNHAQGVALAARLAGVRATIVMPSDAPEVKKNATRAYGAEIVGYDRHNQDRETVAAAVIDERGGVIVPPFNDYRIIAGQGTVGLECAQEWPGIDIAVIPVGGGGLTSGMAIALKALVPSIRIIGVEPESADDARQSLAAGRIIEIAPPQTIADGVATQALGSLTFPILRAYVEQIVTVSDVEIADALRFVATRMKQYLEPTGALATAALLANKIPDLAGRRVLSVFCGGNVDAATFAALLTGPDQLERPKDSP